MLLSSVLHVLLCLFTWICGGIATEPSQEEVVRDFFAKNKAPNASGSAHTNNWAVLVCASRYWFNYRVCLVVLLFLG